jgi:hypothetical protein
MPAIYLGGMTRRDFSCGARRGENDAKYQREAHLESKGKKYGTSRVDFNKRLRREFSSWGSFDIETLVEKQA